MDKSTIPKDVPEFTTKSVMPRDSPEIIISKSIGTIGSKGNITSTSTSSGSNRERSRAYWREMDDSVFRVMKIAETTFQTNKKINLIIVIIGIVLLANSIGYAWYKQTADAWSLFSGGIGMVAFMTLFFKNPQESITKSLGNLVQIQMIYKSQAAEFETIRDYDDAKNVAGNRNLDEIISMDKELERVTKHYGDLVRKYLGDPEDKPHEQNTPKVDNQDASKKPTT